jgi:hypothetical protein
MNEKKTAIVLRDLYLAGFLKAKEIPLVGAERRGGSVVFSFEPSDVAEDLIRQFIDDRATVSVKAYKHALKDLKSLISGDMPLAWINSRSQETGEDTR